MESNKELLKLENEYRDEVSHLYKEKPMMKFDSVQSCSNLKERISKLLETKTTTTESSSTSESGSSQESQVEMDIYLMKN